MKCTSWAERDQQCASVSQTDISSGWTLQSYAMKQPEHISAFTDDLDFARLDAPICGVGTIVGTAPNP
jgi:hypothetical protein